MSAVYTYIWEYTIDSAYEQQFIAAYAPDGEWAQLFQRHDGYIKTELHRDRDNPNRFVTIDHWTNRKAWEAFRENANSEFRTLDGRCEAYTLEEREIGTFNLK